MFFVSKGLTHLKAPDLSAQNRLLLARETGIWLGYKVLFFGEEGIQFLVPNSKLRTNHILEITLKGDGLDIKEKFLATLPFFGEIGERKIFSGIFYKYLETISESWYEQAWPKLMADGEWFTSEEFVPLKRMPIEPLTITPLLVLANLLVFVAMFFESGTYAQPELKDFVKWGANYRPKTLDLEYFRLVTNAFLHNDLNHLVSNLMFLTAGGLVLESILGRFRFFAYYLIFTLVASMGSLYWNEGKVAFGASGPVYGIMGMLLVVGFTDFVERQFKISILITTLIYLGYSYLEFGKFSNVDLAAHVTGFLAGLTMGMFSLPSLAEPQNAEIKWNTVKYSTLVVFPLVFFLLQILPNDFEKLESMFSKMRENNKYAESHYQNWDKIPKREALIRIKEEIIMKYDENIRLCNLVRKLKVNPQNLERNETLLQYFVFKNNYFRLLSKQIRNPDPRNLPKLQYGNQTILDLEKEIQYILISRHWTIPID